MADATARPLTAHPYVADETAAPDHRDRRPCRWCPLPAGNRIHDQDAVDAAEADRDAAHAEHLRRIGEDN
ncbi:hypothetical protein [Micromonospora sp. NBRC 101691]|uniref:hypothetical protein n=1 Tax=Micromonospora sp. NBRC 101691 TaxID=3032198 RepID=UPI0024A0F49F|nr:hypothetical protein [Micromonospora sp. NBRC 101691]GLY21668.1 hypothetical protein Misp04_14000 [Micromonospora sp. NBRC 101691]